MEDIATLVLFIAWVTYWFFWVRVSVLLGEKTCTCKSCWGWIGFYIR